MKAKAMKQILMGIISTAIITGAMTGCDSSSSSTAARDEISSEASLSSSSSSSETTTETSAAETSSTSEESSKLKAVTASFTSYTGGKIDTTDIFSQRDLEQEADLSEAKLMTVSDNSTIDIVDEGVYVISGSAKNCTIKIDADKENKVQIVLDGVTVENDSAPVIYVVSADKCFVTTTDSENTLSVTGTFTADGDTNTDAVIFSKSDMVLNGVGTLNVSSTDNGISSKDDLKVTGGTYNVNSTSDAFEANDSVAICGGTFNITSQKDGIHAENDEDNTVGYVYIAGGTFTIDSQSDGIQATTVAQIDGGTFNISSSEGIEGTYVQINGGDISIDASDDGINATTKSSAYDVVAEFNGGNTTIVMGQGDTDAVDANGNIYVNDGTINITATVSSFDYDGTAQFNGGTIIINGEEVSEIPQSMMGGGGRGGFGGGFGGQGGGDNFGGFSNF